MRKPGVIPPGKAGIFLLAAALVPVALKELKPLARAAGRGLRKLGDAVDRLGADEPERPEAAAVVEEPAKPKKVGKKAKKTKPDSG